MCVCVFFRSSLFFLWIAGWKGPDIRPRASGNRKARTRLFLFPLSKLVELTRKSDEAQRAFPASFSVPRHRQQASYENFVFYQSNMNIFQFHGSLNTFASTLLERISKRIETKILSFGKSPKASYFFFLLFDHFLYRTINFPQNFQSQSRVFCSSRMSNCAKSEIEEGG